jgi:hypothetical protein
MEQRPSYRAGFALDITLAVMCIVLCSSPELKISLDPVRLEERVPSVAFDLLVQVEMPFQQARITIKERWFTHDALNGFEDELSDLRSTESGEATLLDMSERPVLQIVRQGSEIKTVIRSSDSMKMIGTVVEVKGYAAEVAILHKQLCSYEKWW